MRWPWTRRREEVEATERELEAAKRRLAEAKMSVQNTDATIERANSVLADIERHKRSNGFAELIEKAMAGKRP